MDRILFVVPPNVGFDSYVNPAFNIGVVQKGSGSFRNIVADPPMGLLSISAYLKKHRPVEVQVLDFNVVLNKLEDFRFKSFSDFFRAVFSRHEWIDYAPDIVGISTLFSPAYYNMLDAADAARSVFPTNTLVLAGGGIPTNLYSQIFKDNASFDALCFGEGEKPMLALIEAEDRRDVLNLHPSWITKEKAAKGHSPQYDFIENLDEIPFYDYGILEPLDYRQSTVLSTFVLVRERTRSVQVMTSRGCPHFCCFCASNTVHGRKMRYYSLPRVKEDFKRLRDEFGASCIVIDDDHFMASKQRFLEIIKILRELDLTAFFPNSLALYALDREVLESVKSVGVTQLVLSVESGSERVLKEIMHKPLNLSIVDRVLADCRDLGISSDVAILIGLPGETKADIEDARKFLKTLNATWFRINVATPLVGTEMLEVCLKRNYLRGSILDCDFKKAIVETEDFTPEYILEKAYSLNLELNFVGNKDFELGNYHTALKGFENTIRVRDDHAFAHYYAAKCHRMLGQDEMYSRCRARYQEIIEKSVFWKDYAEKFSLAALET